MQKEREASVLELILPPESDEGKHSGKRAGITIGTLMSFNESGDPMITFPHSGLGEAVKALSVVALVNDSIGRTVALQFEEGDPARPVILGVIQNPVDAVEHPAASATETAEKRVEVRLDGERLVFSADKEIVLRCGKSSITLTRAGKVLIRGAYLLSRSSGVNRIKGGSVQIN
jgi:hypothetical protein